MLNPQPQPASFKRDFNWQDGYLPDVRRILLANAHFLLNVQIASHYLDVKQATDMVVAVNGFKKIAVRLRRADYHYRDLTIRAGRTSGAQTELEKIQRGAGDLYLYGWTHSFQIAEWMLVDMHRLRASGLLSYYSRRTVNHDAATSFVHIPYRALRQYGCILNANVR